VFKAFIDISGRIVFMHDKCLCTKWRRYIYITSVFILTPHWQKTTPLLTNSGDLQQWHNMSRVILHVKSDSKNTEVLKNHSNQYTIRFHLWQRIWGNINIFFSGHLIIAQHDPKFRMQLSVQKLNVGTCINYIYPNFISVGHLFAAFC